MSNFPSSVELLARFEQIYTEHQIMAATLALLQRQLHMREGNLKVAAERMSRRIEELQKLATIQREARSWLRAISLEHPETKSLVNQALADLRQYEDQ